MPVFKMPVIRQYFHKGLLWRASETEEVQSFELFIDLLYVGIIAIMGDRAAETPSGEALLQFCVTFLLSWKLWSDITLVVSWIETDDIIQRVCIVFVMICLVGFTINITDALTTGTTYTQLIAFYLTQRLFLSAYYLWVGYLLPMVRGTMIAFVVAIVIPSTLWIASIQVTGGSRLALIWIAIPLDLFGSGAIVGIMHAAQTYNGAFWTRMQHYLDFYPGVNIEHKSMRHFKVEFPS